MICFIYLFTIFNLVLNKLMNHVFICLMFVFPNSVSLEGSNNGKKGSIQCVKGEAGICTRSAFAPAFTPAFALRPFCLRGWALDFATV
jgi:hypothetical protein